MEYCKVSSTNHSLSTNNLFFNLKDPQCMDSWTVMPPGSGYNCELCWSVLFPLVKLFLAACWGGGGEGGGAVVTFDNCVWSNCHWTPSIKPWSRLASSIGSRMTTALPPHAMFFYMQSRGTNSFEWKKSSNIIYIITQPIPCHGSHDYLVSLQITYIICFSTVEPRHDQRKSTSNVFSPSGCVPAVILQAVLSFNQIGEPCQYCTLWKWTIEESLAS